MMNASTATAMHITKALSTEHRTSPITLFVLFQMNDKVVPVAVSTSYYEMLRTIVENSKTTTRSLPQGIALLFDY
jgi:hypothetical protein